MATLEEIKEFSEKLRLRLGEKRTVQVVKEEIKTLNEEFDSLSSEQRTKERIDLFLSAFQKLNFELSVLNRENQKILDSIYINGMKQYGKKADLIVPVLNSGFNETLDIYIEKEGLDLLANKINALIDTNSDDASLYLYFSDRNKISVEIPSERYRIGKAVQAEVVLLNPSEYSLEVRFNYIDSERCGTFKNIVSRIDAWYKTNAFQRGYLQIIPSLEFKMKEVPSYLKEYIKEAEDLNIRFFDVLKFDYLGTQEKEDE